MRSVQAPGSQNSSHQPESDRRLETLACGDIFPLQKGNERFWLIFDESPIKRRAIWNRPNIIHGRSPDTVSSLIPLVDVGVRSETQFAYAEDWVGRQLSLGKDFTPGVSTNIWNQRRLQHC